MIMYTPPSVYQTLQGPPHQIRKGAPWFALNMNSARGGKAPARARAAHCAANFTPANVAGVPVDVAIQHVKNYRQSHIKPYGMFWAQSSKPYGKKHREMPT